ncbi:MAG: D-alanyl-D-alanine carboxypeptidase family protein [Bacteroidetes bacterium]|nr:MAG: D-alanyl-D-alanine carboxypeptidase family protein [Bacteroidota bacterium]
MKTFHFILSIIIFSFLSNNLKLDYVHSPTPFPSHQFTKNELMGKVNPKKDIHFVKIENTYTSKTNIYLRESAYNAYKNMFKSAQSEGITLNIISAFRSFYHQKSIWEAKWTGKRKVNGQDLSKNIPNIYKRAETILHFSSMPGSSRHHWGTDIDIYDLNNSTFENGQGLKVYKWLQNNAFRYGFYQVYTANRPFGYEEEKWHWSYLPLAKPMINTFNKLMSNSDFNGFLGAQTADSLQIIQHYVNGINQECL